MSRPVAGGVLAALALGSLVALWAVRSNDTGGEPPPTDGATSPTSGTDAASGARGAVAPPPVGGTWQYQLTGSLDLDVDADTFDVDGEETTEAEVTALHDRGAYVVCYVSAGSHEDWRSDADRFPDEVLGRPLDGWPGERWLDVRRTDVLLPIMEARLERCRAKGFDAVELDNVDAHTNDTGFPLTAADQLRYNRLLADAAHRAGLAVALKNDAEQVADLVDAFDLAIVEECIGAGECERFLPFVEQGKPVLLVEYDLTPDEVCPVATALGFSAIVKDLDLDAARRACDP